MNALEMELGQTITSAVKKLTRRTAWSKNKRLTFQDEVNAMKSEVDQKLKSSTHITAAKSTNFLTFGFVLIKSFSQQGLDIVGVKREMNFQKYQFNMARIITYSEKFNVYFVLQKDFGIKVFNKDYAEICSVENPRSVRLTAISFNPVRDELICGGFKGVKTWKFKERKVPVQANPIPMYNYSLFPSTEYPYMGKKWCTNMDFDVIMQRYYCFSEGHFFSYDINGNMILEIPNAHETAILSCVYSSDVHILLTSSKGNEIKSWNDSGYLLHVFQGHSRAVTKILLHPSTTSLFISGSLDGSVKLWSFDSLDVFYSLPLFQEGILWIGTMEDKFLYCCSARNVHIYDLNLFTCFWAEVNSPVSHLCLCSADGKSSRIVAMGVDNSLRIFSLHNGTKLCTVLPPPYPSPLQPILSFAYNRASGTVYFLLTYRDIWIYTARKMTVSNICEKEILEIHQDVNASAAYLHHCAT
ncbi:putative coatomer subunit beta' [Varanus komodoensis]|nr:putative coatomer subunit beta' [Varanus komodoensis]